MIRESGQVLLKKMLAFDNSGIMDAKSLAIDIPDLIHNRPR